MGTAAAESPTIKTAVTAHAALAASNQGLRSVFRCRATGRVGDFNPATSHSPVNFLCLVASGSCLARPFKRIVLATSATVTPMADSEKNGRPRQRVILIFCQLPDLRVLK